MNVDIDIKNISEEEKKDENEFVTRRVFNEFKEKFKKFQAEMRNGFEAIKEILGK